MPVIKTETVQAICKLPGRDALDDKVYCTAVLWSNNIFRLTDVCFWANNGIFAPEKIHVSHSDFSKEEKDIILAALVNEWNKYAYADELDVQNCHLAGDKKI